jgi:hypothetical protein
MCIICTLQEKIEQVQEELDQANGFDVELIDELNEEMEDLKAQLNSYPNS